MEDAVIQLQEAAKDYGRKTIGPITFSVRPGEIVGFLGPNGSGKSTTIRMLLGLMRPTSGLVRLNGLDPLRQHVQALAGVGYSPELPNLQTFLSPRELLSLTASELGVGRSAAENELPALLEKVGLIEYKDYKIAKLSKGMVQRLSVAQAMVGSPDLLILDEPMIGIDPAGVVHFRTILRDFVKDGGTIVMSSHILSEVESLCTSLAVIHSGKLVFRGELGEFIRRGLSSRMIVVELDRAGDGLVATVSTVKGVTRVTPTPGGLLVEISKDSDPRAEIARAIVDSGAGLLSMGYSRNELDEAYMNSMKGTMTA